MAKSNKANTTTSVLITTIVFAVIAVVFMIIGYKNEIVSWMATCGLALLMLSLPVILFIVYKLIMNKIERM